MMMELLKRAEDDFIVISPLLMVVHEVFAGLFDETKAQVKETPTD